MKGILGIQFPVTALMPCMYISIMQLYLITHQDLLSCDPASEDENLISTESQLLLWSEGIDSFPSIPRCIFTNSFGNYHYDCCSWPLPTFSAVPPKARTANFSFKKRCLCGVRIWVTGGKEKRQDSKPQAVPGLIPCSCHLAPSCSSCRAHLCCARAAVTTALSPLTSNDFGLLSAEMLSAQMQFLHGNWAHLCHFVCDWLQNCDDRCLLNVTWYIWKQARQARLPLRRLKKLCQDPAIRLPVKVLSNKFF